MLLDEYCLEVDDMLDNQDCDKSLQSTVSSPGPSAPRRTHNQTFRSIRSNGYSRLLWRSPAISVHLLHDAARRGQLNCIKYVYDRLNPEEKRHCTSAKLWKDMIRFGHSLCISFLLAEQNHNFPEYMNWEYLMTYAIRFNQIECLKKNAFSTPQLKPTMALHLIKYKKLPGLHRWRSKTLRASTFYCLFVAPRSDPKVIYFA